MFHFYFPLIRTLEAVRWIHVTFEAGAAGEAGASGDARVSFPARAAGEPREPGVTAVPIGCAGTRRAGRTFGTGETWRREERRKGKEH